MRRRLVNRCLVLFVILYLIGGVYFYVLSSGGNDVEEFRDYDPEVGYQKRAYLEPNSQTKSESENKNVVIEYSEQFESKDELDNRSPVEESDSYQNDKGFHGIQVDKHNETTNGLRATENGRPRKLMNEKKPKSHRKKRQFRKRKLDIHNEETFSNTSIHISPSEDFSKLQFITGEVRATDNEGAEERGLVLEQKIKEKAEEYIKRKFLHGIKRTPNPNEAQNSSILGYKTDNEERLRRLSKLETFFKNNTTDENLTNSYQNTTENGDKIKPNLIFPSSSFPTENLNNHQAFRGIYVYSAFLDDRKDQTFVRIILIARSNKNVPQLWCHFRPINNPSGAEYISDLAFYETCENHMKEYAAYVGSCAVQDISVDTSNVILSNSAIQGTGLTVGMDVIHNKFTYGYRHKFSTCVPPLFGNVTALRLAEFVEMSQILGVEHFIFYFDNFDKEVQKLLFYYAHVGIATVLPWNMTLTKRELWYHGQSAAVWDCLFRTMFISEFVSFNDIDEFLIPQKHNTWNEMFIDLQKSHPKVKVEHVAAYRFYSAFFDSNFKRFATIEPSESSQLLTMSITTRTSRFSRIRTKMIVYPTRVFELGIHHLSKPMEEHFQCLTVETDFAILNHYRSCDWNFGMNCDKIEHDETALKYREVLLKKLKLRLLKANEFVKKNLLLY